MIPLLYLRKVYDLYLPYLTRIRALREKEKLVFSGKNKAIDYTFVWFNSLVCQANMERFQKSLLMFTSVFLIQACIPVETSAPQQSSKWDQTTWNNLIWADETTKPGELEWNNGNWDELKWAN